MNEQIENRIIAIKSELKLNLITGADAVIQLAKEYAVESKDRSKALILKANLHTAIDEEKKVDIQKELLELCDTIATKISPKNTQLIKEKEKKRKSLVRYYNKRGIKKDIVFKGEMINKSFKKSHFKLSDVSLTLRLGEITGIVGENGNGKNDSLPDCCRRFIS